MLTLHSEKPASLASIESEGWNPPSPNNSVFRIWSVNVGKRKAAIGQTGGGGAGGKPWIRYYGPPRMRGSPRDYARPLFLRSTESRIQARRFHKTESLTPPAEYRGPWTGIRKDIPSIRSP